MSPAIRQGLVLSGGPFVWVASDAPTLPPTGGEDRCSNKLDLLTAKVANDLVGLHVRERQYSSAIRAQETVLLSLDFSPCSGRPTFVEGRYKHWISRPRRKPGLGRRRVLECFPNRFPFFDQFVWVLAYL